jgi:hypothetical protein
LKVQRLIEECLMKLLVAEVEQRPSESAGLSLSLAQVKERSSYSSALVRVGFPPLQIPEALVLGAGAF